MVLLVFRCLVVLLVQNDDNQDGIQDKEVFRFSLFAFRFPTLFIMVGWIRAVNFVVRTGSGKEPVRGRKKKKRSRILISHDIFLQSPNRRQVVLLL